MVKLTYKYLNLQTLQETTGGNLAIEIELLELFNDIIEEYIAILEEELPNKNWKRLSDATHKIKPNITLFGIHSMEPVIENLEMHLKHQENPKQIHALVNHMIDVFKEVKTEIGHELDSMGKN